LVDSDLHSENSDRFSAEIDFDGKDVGCSGDVSGSNRFSSSESTCDVDVQDIVAVILAIDSRFYEIFRKIVESDVKNDFAIQV